jgi:hypothetical protein
MTRTTQTPLFPPLGNQPFEGRAGDRKGAVEPRRIIAGFLRHFVTYNRETNDDQDSPYLPRAQRVRTNLRATSGKLQYLQWFLRHIPKQRPPPPIWVGVH